MQSRIASARASDRNAADFREPADPDEVEPVAGVVRRVPRNGAERGWVSEDICGANQRPTLDPPCDDMNGVAYCCTLQHLRGSNHGGDQ